MTNPVFSIMYVMGIGGVLIAAHFLTKKIAMVQSKIVSQQGTKRLKVLETVHVGPNKSILLIEIEGEKHLIGTGKETIEYLSKVQASELKKEEEIT